MKADDPVEKQLAKLRRMAGIREDETWHAPKVNLPRYKALLRRLFRQLRESCPSLSERTAGAVATDLADIRDIAQCHEYFIREFLKLQFPKDARRLEGLLIRWIDVELLFHCQWHLKSLRRRLPKVLKAINDPKSHRKPQGEKQPKRRQELHA